MNAETVPSSPVAPRPTPLIGALVVGALTLFSGIVNWQWLRANVVTYGWDRMDHLITSLAYNNILQSLTPRALYEALAFADYYPPLVHFGIVLAYKLFGVDEDIAAMTNILYLALLLGATWSITRRVWGSGAAALATFIIGTFPMIFMMSRYLYLDFALTALVAVSLALLLATERFTRRAPSLLFGLALGLSFLVKWTAAAFLAAPLLYVLWRGGVIQELVRRPALLRPDPRRLLVALGISAALVGAWLLPIRAQVEQNPIGVWLVPAFALLGGLVVYALLPGAGARGGRAANALSAGAVGAFVIALWYLVNTEFITGFFYTAYGREEGRFLAFDKYLYEVVTEQIGPMYTLLFLLVAGAWLWRKVRARGGEDAAPLMSDGAVRADTVWVLLLWAIVPYMIFSAGVSLAHSRFLMPFLPPFAIALAVWIAGIRQQTARWLAAGAVVALALGQFALLSFEAFAPWQERFTVSTPMGSVNLLANGFFIQPPASGDTDPSYAIAPDILERAERARVAQGRDYINVGVLVNSHQLHEKHFLYQIYIRYPNVLLRELARNWSENPAYAQIFEMDYVLVSDTHSYRTSSESQAVIERLLYDQRDLFNQAFKPVQEWTFLSGERVTLYERRFAPTTPGAVVEDYQAVVQALGGELQEGDAVLLVAPDQGYVVGLTFPDGTGARFIALESAQDADSIRLQLYERLFLLSHNAEQFDPEGEIEQSLRLNFVEGGEQWFGSVRVVPFLGTVQPVAPATVNARWENGTVLESASVEPRQAAVSVHLRWGAAGEGAQKVSVQLLASDGTLIAQQDAERVEMGQSFALLIPRAMQESEYRVVVALYDPTTLARYPLAGGGDLVELPQ